jgi:hypothetical protein
MLWCTLFNTFKLLTNIVYRIMVGYLLEHQRDKITLSNFFNWYSGGWSPIGSTRHCGHWWPIVPAPGDYDGEIGGMIGQGNWSTLRKPAPVPLLPPQTSHAARTQTRATAVGSQQLTTWATAWPNAEIGLREIWEWVMNETPKIFFLVVGFCMIVIGYVGSVNKHSSWVF